MAPLNRPPSPEPHCRVAEKLPRPNLLLLKHLLSVLYLVSKNAEVSKMDASNLAICVGPNMLTRENDQSLSLEAQKDLNNQVCSSLFWETQFLFSLPARPHIEVMQCLCVSLTVRHHSEDGKRTVSWSQLHS